MKVLISLYRCSNVFMFHTYAWRRKVTEIRSIMMKRIFWDFAFEEFSCIKIQRVCMFFKVSDVNWGWRRHHPDFSSFQDLVSKYLCLWERLLKYGVFVFSRFSIFSIARAQLSSSWSKRIDKRVENRPKYCTARFINTFSETGFAAETDNAILKSRRLHIINYPRRLCGDWRKGCLIGSW